MNCTANAELRTHRHKTPKFQGRPEIGSEEAATTPRTFCIGTISVSFHDRLLLGSTCRCTPTTKAIGKRNDKQPRRKLGGCDTTCTTWVAMTTRKSSLTLNGSGLYNRTACSKRTPWALSGSEEYRTLRDLAEEPPGKLLRRQPSSSFVFDWIVFTCPPPPVPSCLPSPDHSLPLWSSLPN